MIRTLPALALFCMGTAVLAATPERYIHVKVDNARTGEKVRVNIPLSLAEKVIPAIDHGRLRHGEIEIGNFEANGVDLPRLLHAVKDAPDGEYVTVENKDNDVRVVKSNGTLFVHIVGRREKQNVEVTIPWSAAQALASATSDHELNVEAAIEALERTGNTTLVTVTDTRQTVRVWIDSRNTID